MITPKFYTEYEGGPWHRFVGGQVEEEDLANAPHFSFAFDDTTLGQGRFGRWDQVCGWTTTIKQAEEEMQSLRRKTV